MGNDLIAEYLTALGEAMSEYVTGWAVDDGGGEPVLALTAPAPYDETRELGYLVSVSRYSEELFLFELQISVFMDVPQEMFADVHRVIAALNNVSVVGSFMLYEETLDVICRSGVFIDPAMTIDTMTNNILRTLAAMENTAVSGAFELQKLLKGEATADELTEALQILGGDAQ